MNTHLYFAWLLRVSWQASVLAVVILAVQWAFQRQLSARWRYALWFLLMARLVLPILPSSPVSIFNLVPRHQMPAVVPVAVGQTHFETTTTFAQTPLPNEQRASSLPLPTAALPAAAQPVRQQAALPQISLKSSGLPRWSAWQFMALIWLVGLIFFATRVIVQDARFLRRLATAAPVTDTHVLSLVDACRVQMGINSKIRLVESAVVKSPALHGFWRSTLLLPPGMTRLFTEAELRHIFLHELAHIKRNDMGVLALVTLCKLVHWFNPILWLGFRRMAADCELACDELALAYAGERERGPYGETILKLLEACARPVAVPGLIGILGEKEQVRRRILMIANFGERRRSSLPALVLAGVVGVVTLTNAQTDRLNRVSETITAPATLTMSAGSPVPTASDAGPTGSSPEFDKAKAEYQRSLSLYQQDQEIARKDRQQMAAAIFHLGEAYRQQGQREKADEQFQRLVNEFPDAIGFSGKSQQYLLSLRNPPPDFLFSIGNVLYPGGATVDSNGNIYISDTRRDRIDKFSSGGEPITQWGQHGGEAGKFDYPQGLAIDSADHLYVADVENNRIQKFAADGTFLKQWGEPGSKAGQFDRPYNIAVDKDDRVYVVDSNNNRIQEFTSEGVYLRTFGGPDADAGGLRSPQGVAVDASGNVYVGNQGNDRVEKFLPDGAAQAGFDWAGVHDVAVDASGNIYVANASQSCVKEFTPDGILLTQWGRKGTAPGQFDFLARIAIDRPRGRILITDAQNDRVQVFGYATTKGHE
jgi:beta-lactamase regulating signal transducer with metallopeptidase domain/sugar lactone lactonase YvrE